MSSQRHHRFAYSALALCALAVSTASAHDFPTPFQILYQPGRNERTVVALRPGLALTENSGAQWNYVCGAVTGLAGNDAYAAVISGDGHLLIAAFTGIYRDDGMGCTWSALSEDSGLPSGPVASLSLLPDGRVEALTAVRNADNGLYVSDDEGLHWTLAGAQLKAATPNSMVRAPNDPNRLYVAGDTQAGYALWMSRDGGQSWIERPKQAWLHLEVVAVDPVDADRVFVVHRAPANLPMPDSIEVSHDAGETFEPLFTLPMFGALALAPDGETVWFGSREGGLYRAERGAPPQQIHPTLRIGCLQYRDRELWACARDLPDFDPFALAASSDGGESWRTVLRSNQLRRLRTCANPVQASACSAEWNQWKNDVFGSVEEPPIEAPPPPTVLDASVQVASAPTIEMPDAGGSEPRSSATREDGCTAMTPRATNSPGRLIAALFTLFALFLCARRARNRSSPRSASA